MNRKVLPQLVAEGTFGDGDFPLAFPSLRTARRGRTSPRCTRQAPASYRKPEKSKPEPHMRIEAPMKLTPRTNGGQVLAAWEDSKVGTLVYPAENEQNRRPAWDAWEVNLPWLWGFGCHPQAIGHSRNEPRLGGCFLFVGCLMKLQMQLGTSFRTIRCFACSGNN